MAEHESDRNNFRDEPFSIHASDNDGFRQQPEEYSVSVSEEYGPSTSAEALGPGNQRLFRTDR